MNIVPLHATVLLGSWIVPPEHQGQMIEVAFATDGIFIFRRMFDRADRSTVYHRTDASKCSVRDFQPWNGSPRVPASRWASCTARQAGDA